MSDQVDNKTKILGQIKSPLLFFAMALLALEGIIGMVIVHSQMNGEQQMYCVFAMGVIFLIVVLSVVFITIKYPSHLYEPKSK